MVVARDHGQTDGFKRPKLFQSKKKCGATRDAIFSVYNYDDASTLYAFMRSLRGGRFDGGCRRFYT